MYKAAYLLKHRCCDSIDNNKALEKVQKTNYIFKMAAKSRHIELFKCILLLQFSTGFDDTCNKIHGLMIFLIKHTAVPFKALIITIAETYSVTTSFILGTKRQNKIR